MTNRATAELREARRLLKELSEELKDELWAKYEGSLNYPSQKRRFERDMSTVYEAQKYLESPEPQPPALGGMVEEIDGLLIELDATKEAAEAIPGLGAAKEVQDAERNLAAALVNAWPTLRANLKQEEWRDINTAPMDGTRILAVTKYGVETVVYREEHYSPDVMGDQANGWKSGWWGVEQDSDCKPEFHSVIRGIVSASHQPTHWRQIPTTPQSKKEG